MHSASGVTSGWLSRDEWVGRKGGMWNEECEGRRWGRRSTELGSLIRGYLIWLDVSCSCGGARLLGKTLLDRTLIRAWVGWHRTGCGELTSNIRLCLHD